MRVNLKNIFENIFENELENLFENVFEETETGLSRVTGSLI